MTHRQEQRDSAIRSAGSGPVSGFTLTEVMIVVAIIGLLMVVAIPNFQRARENAMNSRYAADMRVAADAFLMYAQERGNYPPDVYPGIMPEGMHDYLKRMDWLGQTPLGGKWDWDNWPTVKGVSALEVTASDSQLTRIDRLLDDGNLNRGAFRDRGGGSTYIFILEVVQRSAGAARCRCENHPRLRTAHHQSQRPSVTVSFNWFSVAVDILLQEC